MDTWLNPVGASHVESFFKANRVLFTLLVFYQGLFSGNAIHIPDRLKKNFDNRYFRFLSLLAISFTATRDIEIAIISTLIFLTIIYLIKTPEERAKDGFL